MQDPEAKNMASTYTRRNANGTVGSVYSGNKIRHLKKEDGIPLWRKDIQLEFLRCVFEDETKCFTMPSDKTTGHSFADIYIDTMARSSKSSKVLKEKLLADRAGAMSMAMICLLVNVGRMNTTLNFFPEMRAQLRTFHAIPSLQANQDPNAYKQLQDAPRLKSILKGASEDDQQPATMERLKALPAPRTNPVHLIFLLSQFAPKISEAHFQQPRDFFDLVMRGTLSSKSRAKAFLWLMWWYLESDLSEKAALENPFGPGQHGDDTEGLPVKVPSFEHLTEAQADAENVDTEEEQRYGEQKRQERRRILEDDDSVGPPSKKPRRGPEEGAFPVSDTDPTRSPSPSMMQRKPSMEHSHLSAVVSSPHTEGSAPQGRYAQIASKMDIPNPQRLVLKTRAEGPSDMSSPIAAASGHQNWNAKRPRHETTHQKALLVNRKKHIDHILHKQLALHQAEARKAKKQNFNTPGMMILNRLKELPDMYDSEEDYSWGPGGLVPDRTDYEDYGEESVRHKKAIDRAIRRLDRGTLGPSKRGNVQRSTQAEKASKPQKQRSTGGANAKGKGKAPARPPATSRRSKPKPTIEPELDAMDLELLGEMGDDDQEDESMLDYHEQEDADLTEEEADMRI